MGFEDDGYVSITWTDATRDAAFVSWRIYRRVYGDTTNGILLDEITYTSPTYEFRDWSASSGVTYQYSVVQAALRFGAIVESVHSWSAAETPVGTHYWLVHPSDESLNLKLEHVTADSFSEVYEQNEMLIIGRGRRFDYGTRAGYSGTLTADLRDWDGGATAREQRQFIEQMRAEQVALQLRNPFGDIWRVSMGDVSFSRVAGVGLREHMSVTIPYSEVYV